MAPNGDVNGLSKLPQQNGRVLSIQSHVAFGYVGGKAAVFPLQCLGYDVDVVNTVNFSNHSGYGRLGGTRANAAELSGIFSSMAQNGLLAPERLLTGYIPGAEALLAVASLATKLKEQDPAVMYLLDPVMGDAGKLYVAPDVIPVYQTMLPLATVITPNWFEVEVLTKIQLKDLASLRLALKTLHEEFHVPNVVISSMPFRDWLSRALPPHLQPSAMDDSDSDPEAAFLFCLSSSALENTSEISVIHAQCVPCIPGYFSGVGDLFSALLLAHFQSADTPNLTLEDASRTPLSHATSLALTKTHRILDFTYKHTLSLPEEDRLPTDEEQDAAEPARKIRRMRGRELRLIQGQDIIRETNLAKSRQLQLWPDFWLS